VDLASSGKVSLYIEMCLIILPAMIFLVSFDSFSLVLIDHYWLAYYNI